MAPDHHCQIHVDGVSTAACAHSGPAAEHAVAASAKAALGGGDPHRSRELTFAFAAVGLVLLAASALKFHELTTSGDPLVSRRWFDIVLPTFEAVFGVWLLAGRGFQRVTLRLAILLFSSFAIVTTVKGFQGAAECGCFGNLRVSPWQSLLFSGAALVELLTLQLSTRSRALKDGRRCLFTSVHIRGLAHVVAIFAVGAGVGWRLSAEAAGSNSLHGTEEEWIGAACPFKSDIVISHAAVRPDNCDVVIFYRPDCSRCHDLLNDLESQLSEPNAPFASILLVRIGQGHGSARDAFEQEWAVHGYLPAKKWKGLSTPLVVFLKGGVVTSVSTTLTHRE